MNYGDLKDVIYYIMDMICDISLQHRVRQEIDGYIGNMLDETGEVDFSQGFKKIIDIFCDISMQEENIELISAVYENISQITREDLSEIAAEGVAVIRDLPRYEGVKDMVYHLVDMVCDVSMNGEARELADVILEKTAELPDYEVIQDSVKLIIEAAQDLMKDFPTYEGAMEIAYELLNRVNEHPLYESLLQFVNALPLESIGFLPLGEDGATEDIRDGMKPETSYGMVSNF